MYDSFDRMYSIKYSLRLRNSTNTHEDSEGLLPYVWLRDSIRHLGSFQQIEPSRIIVSYRSSELTWLESGCAGLIYPSEARWLHPACHINRWFRGKASGICAAAIPCNEQMFLRVDIRDSIACQSDGWSLGPLSAGVNHSLPCAVVFYPVNLQ